MHNKVWNLEPRKKIEGMKFKGIYKLEVIALRYENLLKEEKKRRILIYGIYWQETMDIDVAEFVLRKPVNCEVLTKKKKYQSLKVFKIKWENTLFFWYKLSRWYFWLVARQ